MRFLMLLVLLPLLAACLPAAGPSSRAIHSSAEQSSPPFTVIDVDQTNAELLAEHASESLSGTFGIGGGAATIAIGVGDQVVVTIFEAASGGLFSGDPGVVGGTKSVSLPLQPVASDGTIGVPYVGRVRAAGMTPAEVQAVIVTSLRDKAIEPQVIVTVTESASSYVTVAGEVGKPGRVPLTLRGDRLLDVLVSSGGSRAPDYDSFVRLTRKDRSVTVGLARIVRDSEQNIYLRPDDLIYVYVDPQTYTAFGATQANATYAFQTDRLTLAAAMGRAGGLNDSRANAKGVFVFRYEDPELYALVSGGKPVPASTNAGIPVVYSLSLKDPQGYFVAQRFLMRDNDVLYVSNAGAAELQKAIGVISGTIGAAGTVRGTSDLFQAQ